MDITTIELASVALEAPDLAGAKVWLDILLSRDVHTVRLTHATTIEPNRIVFSSFSDPGPTFGASVVIRAADRTLAKASVTLDFALGPAAAVDVPVGDGHARLSFRRRPVTFATPPMALESSVPAIPTLAGLSSDTRNEDVFDPEPRAGALRGIQIFEVSLVEVANLASDAGGEVAIRIDSPMSQVTTTTLELGAAATIHPDLAVFRARATASELRIEVRIGGEPPSSVTIDTSHGALSDVVISSAPSHFRLTFAATQRAILVGPHPAGHPVIFDRESGEFFGPITPPADGTDPRDIPEWGCPTFIVGPDCICTCATFTYTVISRCPGKCTDWQIDDGGAGIATIVEVRGCTIRVKGLKPGEFDIRCTRLLASGAKIVLEKHVRAYEMNHVLGGTKDVIVKTTPLIQPHPFLRITSPASTANGQTLRKDVDFKVHARRLDADLRATEPALVAARMVAYELRVAGSINDFFLETRRCRWEVTSRGGRSAKRIDLVKGQEFEDFSFETKLPGEGGWNERVVLLEGIGKHEVKVTATNPILREGSHVMVVMIDLEAAALSEIERLQRDLNGKRLASPDPQNDPVVAEALEALRQAMRRALLDPRIQVAHQFLVPQSFALAPTDRTRTQYKVFEDKLPPQIDGRVKTNGDDQRDTLEEEDPKVFLSVSPVKSYWAVPECYVGTAYEFPRDGNLRGDMGSLLTSDVHCCSCDIPIFGVEADVPPCVHLRAKEPKVVGLMANGVPSDVDGTPGQYRWTVIAKPSPDATAEIEPVGFTPSKSARLTVDTQGVYTLKVEYRLGGRSSSLTYALADTRVLFARATAVTWSVRRMGKYEDPFLEHARLPYYQERRPQEPVRAAELLIEPAASSPSGSTSRGTAHIASSGAATVEPDLVIGQELLCELVPSPGLELADGLRLRAYFKPYDPELTSADYEDFAVTIEPDRRRARAHVKTEREMYAVHVFDVRCRHVDRLEGAAATISLRYQLTNEVCPRTPAPGATATAFTQPTVALATGAEPPADEGMRDAPTLVNLIVYQRDTGLTRCSGLSEHLGSGTAHNVPNGNLHLAFDFLSALGHGVSMRLGVAYSSWSAIYHDSLELYRRLNGVTDEHVDRHWGRLLLGKGWSCDYGMQLRHYLKPRDAEGRSLEHFLELVCGDGNRIQFRGREVDAEGRGRYTPEHESVSFLGSPIIGPALVVDRRDGAAILRTIHGTSYHFDGSGDLERVSVPANEHTSTPPLTLVRSGDDVEITDSCGRKATLRGIPAGQRAFSGPLLMDLPNGTVQLTLRQGRVENIDWASTQSWTLEHHDSLGQGDTCSVVKKLTDPRQHASDFEYYRGGAFEGVPEEVAAHFWGRLGRTVRGTTQRRVHTWLYEGASADRQRVIHRTPRDIDVVCTYDVERLALLQIAYVRKERDPVTRLLLDRPRYIPAGQDSASLEPVVVRSIAYKDGSKLPTSMTDVYGDATTFEYEEIPGLRAFQQSRRRTPDGTLVLTEYDPVTRFPSRVSTPTRDEASAQYTVFQYSPTFEITERAWPANPDCKAEDGTPLAEPPTERWRYAPATGLLETHTDVLGTVYTFGYEEDGRDPGRTRRPTSHSVTLASGRTLTWKYAYDALGNKTSEFEPLYGEEQTTEYYPYNDVKKVWFQAIPTIAGSERTFIEYGYDAALHRTSVSAPGRTERYVFDEHDELSEYTDVLGTTYVTRHDEDGVVSETTNGAGAVTRYHSDELGRAIKKVYPEPDAPGETAPSEPFVVTIDWDDVARTATCRRYRADASGEPVGDPVVENVDVFEAGRVREQRTRSGAGSTVTIAIAYDVWGEISETLWHDGPTLMKRFRARRDAWGRVVEEDQIDEVNRDVRRVRYGRRADGAIVSQTNGPGGTSYRRDVLGRLTHVLSRDGTTLSEVRITDFDAENDVPAKTEVLAQDPSLESGSRLIASSTVEYNRRGQEVRRVDALGVVTERRYDSRGRLREIHTNSGVTSYDYDDADRLVLHRYETTEVGNVSLAGLDRTDAGTTRRALRTVKSVNYAWTDQPSRVTLGGGAGVRYEYDRHGRLKRVLGESHVEEQVIAYDAQDRVIRRALAGGRTQVFAYDDEKREVQVRLDTPDTVVRASYTLDWQHQLKKYEAKRPITVGWMSHLVPSGVSIEYTYNGLGDLREKIYREGEAERARVVLAYDEAGALHSQAVIFKTASDELRFDQVFEYDDALRIQAIKLTSGSPSRTGEKTHRFGYNAGGLVKSVDLAMPTATATYDEASTLPIRFSHDSAGRLTTIVDGRQPYQGVLSLSYAHQARSYLAGTFSVRDLETRDLGPASALKGLTYTRGFEGWHGRVDEYTFTQDFMNAADGPPHSWVSQVKFGVRGAALGPSSGLEVWRTSEVRGNDAFSYRRHVFFNAPLNTLVAYNSRVRASGRSGRIEDIHIERNRATPFDAFFPVPPPVSQADKQGDSRELCSFDRDTHLPSETLIIFESEEPTDVTAKAAPYQLHKRHYHDAAGRLCLTREWMEPRDPSEVSFTISSRDAEESLINEVYHLYGPDGVEMEHVIVPREDGDAVERKLFIHSGDTLVGVVDPIRQRCVYHETIGGLGIRLATQAGSLVTKAITDEMTYSWDHTGATTVVRDAQGRILADFGIPTPDGDTNPFGFNRSRLPSERVDLLARSGHSKTDFYGRGSGSIDYLLGQAIHLQSRTAHAQAALADATAIGSAGNDYGTPTGAFAFREHEYSLSSRVGQGLLDGYRGLIDAFTGGLATELRTDLYGQHRDYQVHNPWAYGAGMVVGVAASFYLAEIAAVGPLVQATTRARAAWLVTVSSDILGFVQSVKGVASGRGSIFDWIGLAAPLSIHRSLSVASARNGPVLSRIAQARNARRPMVELRRLAANAFEVIVHQTLRLDRIEGPKIIESVREHLHLIRFGNGRDALVGEFIEGCVEIPLSKEARDWMRNNGIVFAGDSIRNAEDADNILRQVFRYLNEDYRNGMAAGSQVGHLLDLKINDFQVKMEIETVQGILESLALGMYGRDMGKNFLRTFLSTLFEAQHGASNAAIGAGLTKKLARVYLRGDKAAGINPGSWPVRITLGEDLR